MKKLIFSWLLSILFLSAADAQYSTDRTGYEGDYFSLEGALDLFKQSHTLNDFERKLNSKENWVNNLDLNYDGRIDYIRVEHRREGSHHAIILQALLDRRDIQDVAVIEIEVTGRREAILQIVGDEDLYGEEVIVEPVEGYSDSRSAYHADDNDYVNVYYWEPVQYILGQQYRVYVSPYRWQYYPSWWSPWSQCSWNVFRPRIVIYHKRYHVVHLHRVIVVHNFYRPYRSYSHHVEERTNQVRISHGKSPVYRQSPAARQDRIPGDDQRRDHVAQRPGIDTPSSTREQSPSISRKRTISSADQDPGRERATGSGRSINSQERPRSTTPDPRPSGISRNATRSYDQKESRSTAPAIKQPSRSTTTRSTEGTRVSSTPPKTERSAAPASVNQSSRNQPIRSSTTAPARTMTRSTTPARQPSAGNSRSMPAAKPKADNSTTSKRSSSESGSRSRRGGGD